MRKKLYTLVGVMAAASVVAGCKKNPELNVPPTNTTLILDTDIIKEYGEGENKEAAAASEAAGVNTQADTEAPQQTLPASETTLTMETEETSRTDNYPDGEGIANSLESSAQTEKIAEETIQGSMTESPVMSSSNAQADNVGSSSTSLPVKAPDEEDKNAFSKIKEGFVKDDAYEGTISVLVSAPEGDSFEYVFRSKGKQMVMEKDAVPSIYIKNGNAYTFGETGWEKSQCDFTALFSPFDSKKAKYNGIETTESGDYETIESGIMPSEAGIDIILRQNNYENPAVKDCTVQYMFPGSGPQYHIGKIELTAAFEYGPEESRREGIITADYDITGYKTVFSGIPDEIALAADSEYVPGTVEDNEYSNETFEIKVAGEDILSFDRDKALENKSAYINSGTIYIEEAFARNEHVELEIASVPVDMDDTANSAMVKFIEHKGLSVTGEPDIQDLCGKETDHANASSVETNASVFALKSGSQVMFLCFTFTDENEYTSVLSCVHDINDDLTWEPETVTMKGFEFTTPERFTVNHSYTSDVYICMESKDGLEYNVFCVDGTSDEQAQADIDESGSVITDDIISTSDGSTYRYLVLQSVSEGVDVYTYEVLRDIAEGVSEAPENTGDGSYDESGQQVPETFKYFTVTLEPSDKIVNDLTMMLENTAWIDPAAQNSETEQLTEAIFEN